MPTMAPPTKTSAHTASSADDGTFMSIPVLKNQFHEDTSLKRVIDLFLPPEITNKISPGLGRFGDEVLSQKVFDWVSDTERNVPYVRGSGRDAFGRRKDELVTSQGWKELQSLGLKEGLVATAYENEYAEYSRVVQFVKYHLWTGSCANVTCPSAMQDGAASLLKRHIDDGDIDITAKLVFRSAYQRLTAREEGAWTSGQWMTERVGGSDVSGTETLATFAPIKNSGEFTSRQIDGSPLGPWVLNGFKWFSSATDSQMTIATAQTPTGLSAFYVPIRRTTLSGSSELNGIRISRLKSKLGTKGLPTAELELKGARAFLVGKEGNGIRELSTMLNITRVHNSVTTMGSLGRGLAVARAFAGIREMPAKGKRRTLRDIPLHIKTLADITLTYRSNMLFTFFTVYCLGLSDQKSSTVTRQACPASERLRPQTLEDLQLLLRLLTPALKALTAKAAINGLQECIEALGGVGYLENEESQAVNVARLYRDANVLSIWEGTTNVLGTDFIKILKGRNGGKTLDALDRWVRYALLLETTLTEKEKAAESAIMERLKWFGRNVGGSEIDDLLVRSRSMMEAFASIIIGTLMIVDARQDGEQSVSAELLRRFLRSSHLSDAKKEDWKTQTSWNSRIVFDEDPGADLAPKL